MENEQIRIDFPVYGTLAERARELLEGGVKQGGIFIGASELFHPGASLEMAFVNQRGEEHFLLHTFVTKVRRSEPHEQVFVCFAQLTEARDALRRLRSILEKEPSLVGMLPDGTEPSIGGFNDDTSGTGEIHIAQVLVIHPDLIRREMMSQELQGLGFQICTTDDGLNALVVLEAFDADAILVWARCPRVPGYELPAALEKRSSPKKVTVIVLVEHGDTEARDLANESGADKVLMYPAPAEELAEAIKETLFTVKS